MSQELLLPDQNQPQQTLQFQTQSPLLLGEIASNHHLASLLNLKSAKLLTWLARTKLTHYTTLRIAKKEPGKYRILHNPDEQMRLAQYLILRKVLSKFEIPDYIYAFEVGKNIPEMAAKHVGKKVVVSLDIKDFFPSIKQTRLLDIFLAAGVHPTAAVTLSEICTYKAFVPQGALTSPKVSNIVAAKSFGPEVKEYCDQHGYTMTIYADDITISSDDYVEDINSLLSTITGIVEKHGFRVNRKKTKVMSDRKRQWICGVVTNVKTNLLRAQRLQLRAIVHNISKNGIEAEASKNELSSDKFINMLQGKLNWFRQLNPQVGGRLYRKFKDLNLGVQWGGEPEVPVDERIS